MSHLFLPAIHLCNLVLCLIHILLCLQPHLFLQAKRHAGTQYDLQKSSPCNKFWQDLAEQQQDAMWSMNHQWSFAWGLRWGQTLDRMRSTWFDGGDVEMSALQGGMQMPFSEIG